LETIQLHRDIGKKEAKELALEYIEEVNIPDPEVNYHRYPHQLSGGMQQRILLAMALCCSPDLLILDEPTTGLDVTTQAKIIDLIDELKETNDTSILWITHDITVISEVADLLYILYAGEVMEHGDVVDVLSNPANPYTQGLVSAVPRIGTDTDVNPIQGQIPDLMDLPSGCIFADRCDHATDECRTSEISLESVSSNQSHQVKCCRWETVIEDDSWETTSSKNKEAAHESDVTEKADELLRINNIRKSFGSKGLLDSWLDTEPPVKAVNGVDLEVGESEVVGLVGESGCGKSTLGRIIIQLLSQDAGEIYYKGQEITESSTALKQFRKDTQIVFQNPGSSLNPKKPVKSIISRPIKKNTDLDKSRREDKVRELLEQVNLPPDEYINKKPGELSGGEQQRIAIARAFSTDPSFVVLDEPVSALDVSVQASLLELLKDLQNKYDTSYLFISHNLGVINYLCDRVAVMYLGEIVEIGMNSDIFSPPHHPYTRALLSSNPVFEPGERSEKIHLEGDVPSPRDLPSGCSFHTRCPQYIGDVCVKEKPELEGKYGDGNHKLSCHHDIDELMDGG